MPASVKSKQSKVRSLRKEGVSQGEFWEPLGVTQSGGSRYENKRNIPKPVQILLYLREVGVLDNEILLTAQKDIKKKKLFLK